MRDEFQNELPAPRQAGVPIRILPGPSRSTAAPETQATAHSHARGAEHNRAHAHCGADNADCRAYVDSHHINRQHSPAYRRYTRAPTASTKSLATIDRQHHAGHIVGLREIDHRLGHVLGATEPLQ